MRTFRLLLLGLLFGTPIASLNAQAPSPFELVRGLREEGLTDLALEYLDVLAKTNPMGEVAVLLPLEYARTRLELASEEVEDAKRNTLLGLARSAFDEFLKNNPTHPLRAQANLEIARLIGLQGKVQMSKARRQVEDKTAMIAEIKKARPYFLDAEKRFEAAGKELQKRVDDQNGESPTEKKQKAADEISVLKAELERGITLFDLGLSFVGDDEVRDRGKYIDQAKAILDKVASKDDKLKLSWVAKAWVAQADYENDRKGDSSKAFEVLLKEKSKFADEGIRLARYFTIRHRFDSAAVNKYALAQADAENWLRFYGRYKDTAEGIATRYLLALSIKQQAEGAVKRDPKTGRLLTPPAGLVRFNLEKAANLYKEIAQSDNEYTDRAVRNRLFLILDLSTGRVDDISLLKTFEESYLAAQVEQAELNDFVRKQTADGGDPTKIPDETKKTYGKIIDLLKRALVLSKPNDSARDLLDARILLSYAYSTAGQSMEAAVLGDHLAHAYPNTNKTAIVAFNALQSYNVAYSEMRKKGEVSEADTDADLERIKNLARFMDKTWPTEAVTDTARYQLGFYLMRERKYPEAFESLKKVSNGYSDIYQVRTYQGTAAFYVQKSTAPEEQKKAVMAKAIADLDVLTPPPEDSAEDLAADYCRARLQQGELYLLSTENYPKVEALGKKVIDDLAKFKSIGKATRAELNYAARTMAMSGVYGQAFNANKEKDYPKVAELLDPIIKEVEGEITNPPAADPIADQAPSKGVYKKRQRDVLVLSLRSTVQEGKIDNAKKVLELLQKSGGSVESTIGTLRQVVREIRAQLDSLRKENKPDEATALAKSFTELLDQIAQPTDIPETMLVFLAQGYSNIDEHAKAVALLERVPAPAGFATATGNNVDESIRNYRVIQMLLANAYRQSKNYTKADALIKSMIGTSAKKGWAFGSIDVRKESHYLLEDQKKFRDALAGWTQLANAYLKLFKPVPGNQKEARDKDTYFELFIETQRCLTLANSTISNEEAKSTQFDKIASKLVELETRNSDLSDDRKKQIRDLLDSHPLLMQKYKAAGGKLADAVTTTTGN